MIKIEPIKEASKSEMYDKLIEYIYKKGYEREIPMALTAEIEKETGIKSEAVLSEMLDAMLERNIIRKPVGSVVPELCVSKDQLKEIVDSPLDSQDFMYYNGKIIQHTKVLDEYKKQIKKWQEKLIDLEITKLTKFQAFTGELPKEPVCDYLEEEDKINAKKEVMDSIGVASYKGNDALYNILRPENTEFNWNEMVDVVINLQRRLAERKEDIESLEQAAKDGTLTSVHFIRHNRALNLQREIVEMLETIGKYKAMASKYGITISYDDNQISITSSTIPELKFESKLLSPELVKAIKKSEDKDYNDYNVNDPLTQEQFITTVKRKKIMLPSDDEEVTTINEIITILNAEGKTLTEENTTQMVLSLVDDGELKYYHLTVPNDELSRFTALVSKSTTILETDNMVPTPKEYDADAMSVEEYEEYLLAFYKVYGLDKDYLPKKDPTIVKRAPYPHEATGPGNTYYTTVYSTFLKQEEKITRVDNNNYIIGKLNALKSAAADDTKAKLDRLIAILNIPDLEAKRAAGELTDCLGFVCETPKVAEAKKIIRELYNEIKLFAQIPIAAVVLPKDPEPLNIPEGATPEDIERLRAKRVEDYEKYLMEHYKKEDPHMVPIKDPLTEKVRKPYIHECLTKAADGKLEIAAGASEHSYYKKAYIPYMAAKGLHYTEKDRIKGKPFTGRRVNKSEDVSENKGIINAVKKLGRKITGGFTTFDSFFTDENVHKVGTVFKRIIKVIAIVLVIALIAKFVIGSGFLASLVNFPAMAIKLLTGTSGLTGAALESAKTMLLSSAIGITGVIWGIHRFRKIRKTPKYKHPDDRAPGSEEEEEVETEEDVTETLTEDLTEGLSDDLTPPPIPDDPTEVDIERILEKMITDYVHARKEYSDSLKLVEDETHSTEAIAEERKEKYDYKEEKKGELVDTILEALSETDENEFDEELGGMKL